MPGSAWEKRLIKDMGYEAALEKAWEQIGGIAPDKISPVKFLADEYEIDLKNRRVFSLACNVPAKDYLTILVLHYAVRRAKGLPALTGEWISFKQLEGGEGYYPAFKKRVLEPIVRKYGSDIQALSGITARFKAKTVAMADAAVAVEVFEGAPVLLTMWKGDDEFGPEANVLFDKSISDIFCTEDAIVMAGFVAYSI
jgi:hypothetical protein